MHMIIQGATNITGLDRMVTDSKHGNCTMKKMDVAGTLHLCLFAVSNISVGQPLLFHYGDKPADYTHMIIQGATNITGLGKMVTDSKHGNCTMKKMDVNRTLHTDDIHLRVATTPVAYRRHTPAWTPHGTSGTAAPATVGWTAGPDKLTQRTHVRNFLHKPQANHTQPYAL